MHKKQKIDTLPSRATSPDACEEHVDHDDDGDFDNFAYEDESLLVNHRFFDYQVGIKRKLRGYQNSVLMPKVKMKDLTFAASDRKISTIDEQSTIFGASNAVFTTRWVR